EVARVLDAGVLVALGGDIATAGPAPAGGWRGLVGDGPGEPSEGVRMPAGAGHAPPGTPAPARGPGRPPDHPHVRPRPGPTAPHTRPPAPGPAAPRHMAHRLGRRLALCRRQRRRHRGDRPWSGRPRIAAPGAGPGPARRRRRDRAPYDRLAVHIGPGGRGMTD